MKNKTVFKIAFISAIFFIAIATYFWYLYFKNHEGEVLAQNVRLELINNGGIDYLNAVVNDDEANIPTYYFKVNNHSANPISYDVILDKVYPNTVNDGCDNAPLFLESELDYELKLDNKVISTGTLSSLKDNLLHTNTIKANSKDSYSLRIWLNETATELLHKHYHYIINVREK